MSSNHTHLRAMALAALSGLIACGEPPPSPELEASSDAVTTTNTYRILRLRFVRFADDNGANPASLTYTNIFASIDALNSVLYRSGSGLRVKLDPATNLNVIERSTTFNNNCTPRTAWARYPHDADGNGVTDDTVDAPFLCPALPENRPQPVVDAVVSAIHTTGAVPVLVRGGFSRVTWDGGWRKDIGGGVGTYFSFLSMPSSFGADTTLAHEFGHVLGRDHTFRDCGPTDCRDLPETSGTPVTVAGIEAQIRADVAQGLHLPDDHAGILRALFDGDVDQNVNDTPPDPNYRVWGNYFGDDLAALEITHLCDPANDSIDLPIYFGAPYNTTHTYHLQPDRQNVMSYFKGCWNYRYFYFSPSQRARIHEQLEDELSHFDHPTVLVPSWENNTQVQIPPRVFGGPLSWASSKITVSGSAPANTALVHVDIRTQTGGYYIDLVSPNGIVTHLQRPEDNNGHLFPSAINRTIFNVDTSNYVTKDGLWELKVADENAFSVDPQRFIQSWHIEFR